MKVQLVDNFKRELNKKPLGSYMIDIVLGRFTTTGPLNAGAIFAMRSDPNKNTALIIRKLFFHTGFAGTAAATAQIFQVKTFSAATHSGGNAITLPGGATKRLSTIRNSDLLDARYADITGTNANALTATNVVYDSSMRSFHSPRNNAAAVPVLMNPYEECTDKGQILLPGEGIAIITLAVSVVGDILTGCITWDEVDQSEVKN